MKKSTIMILALIFGGLSVYAQDSGYRPGYVVTISGDTLRGEVKIRNAMPNRILENAMLRPADGGKESSYSPREASAFVTGDARYLSMDLRDLAGNDTKVFMQLMIDGPLRYFEWITTPKAGTNGMGANEIRRRYLKREGKKLFLVPDFVSRKKLTGYFRDEPAIVEKINAGEYKGARIEVIVNDYNRLKATAATP